MEVSLVDYKIPWAAGILEGEGCFSLFRRPDKPHLTTCAIHCEMTDEDTVNDLQKALGVGKIYYRSNEKRGKRKPSWILSIQKEKEVFNTLLRVMPFLKSRRLEKARELFDAIESKGLERWL